ncbi:MAG: hypothetical protein H7234_07425 [Herminiimonas sp.]|nr:hypothetical protein [Herminiimonas sp.]
MNHPETMQTANARAARVQVMQDQDISWLVEVVITQEKSAPSRAEAQDNMFASVFAPMQAATRLA